MSTVDLFAERMDLDDAGVPDAWMMDVREVHSAWLALASVDGIEESDYVTFETFDVSTVGGVA